MSEIVKISVAKDFTTHPGPRYIRQGPWSGEKFRQSVLVPAFRRGKKVFVDLDGTKGYGSSFLDEAFGGLVREEGLSADEILHRLTLKSDLDASYKIEAENAVKEAKAKNVERMTLA